MVNNVEKNSLKPLPAGDLIVVRVSDNPGGLITVGVKDLTKGHRFSVTATGKGVAAQAELIGDWASVDTSTGKPVVPPQFAPTAFQAARLPRPGARVSEPHRLQHGQLSQQSADLDQSPFRHSPGRVHLHPALSAAWTPALSAAHARSSASGGPVEGSRAPVEESRVQQVPAGWRGACSSAGSQAPLASHCTA